MLKKTLYTILRLTSLFLSASALPLGIAYFLKHGGDISSTTMTIALYTVLMVWAMVFIVVSQTRYPASLAGALTTTVPAVFLVWFQTATDPDWLLSLYTWLLASCTSLLIVGLVLLLVAPSRQTSEKRIPWWGYIIAFSILLFTAYFIYIFSKPFLKTFSLPLSTIVLLGEVLLISIPALKTLLAKNTTSFAEDSLSENWKIVVVATTLITLLATLLVKPVLFM